MSEAKQLPPLPDDVPVAREPEVGPGLPELRFAELEEPTVLIQAPVPTTRSGGGSWLSVMLILFLVGLVAFAIGATIALLLLNGSLDAETGWLKDQAHFFKMLLHHSQAPH